MQAQQLIEERETQKHLAELPLIQMPIIPSPGISVIKIICYFHLFSFVFISLVIGFIYCRSTKFCYSYISTANAICIYSTDPNNS